MIDKKCQKKNLKAYFSSSTKPAPGIRKNDNATTREGAAGGKADATTGRKTATQKEQKPFGYEFMKWRATPTTTSAIASVKPPTSTSPGTSSKTTPSKDPVILLHGGFLEGVYEIELDTKTEYEEF